MKVPVLAVTVAFMVAPSVAIAQTPKPSVWATLASNTDVRQNTNVKKDIASPAFVTFTRPAGGTATRQIGIGILAGVFSKAGSGIDGLIDYQNNTAVSKEQDVFKLGASAHWRLTNLDKHAASPLLAFRSNFKNDAVKTSRSWQTAVGGTVLFKGSHVVPLPNVIRIFGNAFDFVYFPYVGLEFETTYRAADPLAEGNVVRLVGTLSLAIYPAARQLNNRLEFTSSYNVRRDLRDTTNEIEQTHPLFNGQINYFFFKSEKRGEFGVGVTYVNGQDPDQGFAKQNYWQLGLKIRLKSGS